MPMSSPLIPAHLEQSEKVEDELSSSIRLLGETGKSKVSSTEVSYSVSTRFFGQPCRGLKGVVST